jgi:hypothetical protein
MPMKKLGPALALLLLVVASIYGSRLLLGGENKIEQKPEMNADSANLMSDEELWHHKAGFKSHDYGHREEHARKLMSYLLNGMTREEVFELFGEPDHRASDGSDWVYTILTSKIICVYFDPQGRVREVFQGF